MIPKIRFSELEEEWKESILKDFFTKVTQKNIDKKYTAVFTNSAEQGIIDQKDFFNHDVANSDNIGGYYVVKPDDFVYNPRVSTIAPVGPINKNNLGYTGVMSPLYLVFKIDGIDKEWLCYYFKTNKWHPFMKLTGNTGARFDRLSLSDDQFCQMPIIHPESLSEQRRISQFFTLLDETIRLEGERLASLKQVKAASLQSFFPQEGEKEPRVRFKGFSGEWKKVRLGDCGFTYSGIGFPEKEQGGQSGIPFYKVSDMNNIGNEHIMISSNNYVSKKQIEENHWNVCKSLPAIFFAKVGAAVLLDRKRLVVEPCICDNNTMMYCLDTKIWDKYFCLKCFENIRLSALIQVGTLPSYNASTIESIEVFIPSLAEQRALSTYFTNIDEQIRLVSEKIEKMKKVKGACLEGMMV